MQDLQQQSQQRPDLAHGYLVTAPAVLGLLLGKEVGWQSHG